MENSSKINDVIEEVMVDEMDDAEEKDSLWLKTKKQVYDHRVAIIGGILAFGSIALLTITPKKLKKEVDKIYEENKFYEEN